MWRGIKPGAVARSLHNAGECGCRGAFAICAGNQNALQPALGIPQRLSQPPHVRKIKFAICSQLVAERQQITNRSLVGNSHAQAAFGVMKSSAREMYAFISLR